MGRWSYDPPDYDEPEDDGDPELDEEIQEESLDELARFYDEHEPCEP